MKGNYNIVANLYDPLSRLIFGNAIVNAQKFFVSSISPNSTILIVGGGTGWVLEEIAKQHAAGLEITYLDISRKMIDIARKRNTCSNKVIFVNSDIREFVFENQFDIVITPFVFDNFLDNTASSVFNKIDCAILPGGLWLFADFEVSKHTKFWQKCLLKVMYFFFRLVCNIEASRLPDTTGLFNKYGYLLAASKTFFHHFIRAVIYTKRKTE